MIIFMISDYTVNVLFYLSPNLKLNIVYYITTTNNTIYKKDTYYKII